MLERIPPWQNGAVAHCRRGDLLLSGWRARNVMKLMERSREAPKEKTGLCLVEGVKGVGRGEWADGLQSPRSLESRASARAAATRPAATDSSPCVIM